MRITLSTSDKTVHLVTGKGEKVSVRAAERAALRLFHALPGPPPDPAKAPIGFAGAGPLDATTEIAPTPYAPDDDTEE